MVKNPRTGVNVVGVDSTVFMCISCGNNVLPLAGSNYFSQ